MMVLVPSALADRKQTSTTGMVGAGDAESPELVVAAPSPMYSGPDAGERTDTFTEISVSYLVDVQTVQSVATVACTVKLRL